MGGKSWTNQGAITVGGDDRILFGFSTGGTNTLTNAAGATLNLTSTFATPIDFFTGTATLNNAGTLNLTVAGAHTISGSIVFNNTGTVNVDTGTLIIGGSGTDTGTYAVDAGTTLNLSGGTRNLNTGSNITGAGAFAVSGATVSANDKLDIAATGAALSVSGGTLNVGANATAGLLAPVTISGDAELQHFQRAYPSQPSHERRHPGGHAAVTVSGDFTVTGQSALAGTGTFTTQSASTINIGAQTSFLGLVGGKGWTNQGTITVGGDDRILFGFSAGGTNTLTNAAGATLNLTSTFSTPIDFFTGTAP